MTPIRGIEFASSGRCPCRILSRVFGSDAFLARCRIVTHGGARKLCSRLFAIWHRATGLSPPCFLALVDLDRHSCSSAHVVVVVLEFSDHAFQSHQQGRRSGSIDPRTSPGYDNAAQPGIEDDVETWLCRPMNLRKRAALAQPVEHRIRNAEAVSSSLTGGTNNYNAINSLIKCSPQ